MVEESIRIDSGRLIKGGTVGKSIKKTCPSSDFLFCDPLERVQAEMLSVGKIWLGAGTRRLTLHNRAKYLVFLKVVCQNKRA